jgi:hypothetical protein
MPPRPTRLEQPPFKDPVLEPTFALNWLTRRPYRDFHPSFLRALETLRAWPQPEQYDQLARQVPQAAGVRLPQFVSERPEVVRRLGGYEQHVAGLAAVPTRPQSWHDFFNMSVWAHFPRLRWALNSLHVDAQLDAKDPRNGRTPAQNVAATFDEAGMLVVSTSRDVLAELQALHFKRAFWEHRAELVATTRFWLVGHGMLESLLQPHASLAARSLLLHVPALPASEGRDDFRFELDAMAADRIHAWRATRTVLDPIPLLAIPGYSDNDSADFYDDARNIRFDPISRRPAHAPSLTAHASEPVGDGGRGDASLERRVQGE